MWIAVSAIATAIYAVFAIFQWLAIREQANLISRNLDITSRAVDAANRNATAAFEGAKAATLSAEIARDTLYLTQAADIQLADTWWNQADPSVSGMPDAIITAVFKNFGNSAARNVLLDVTLGIPGRPYSLNETPSPPINLAPQQTVNIGFRALRTIIKSPDDLAKIVIGDETMRLHGTIRYEDIFERHHTTSFAASYIALSTSFKIDQYETNVSGTMPDAS